MRGKIGSRTCYACLMLMSAIPNLIKFTDWAGFTPQDREQRILKQNRVPELCAHINENEDDNLFSSITSSYRSSPVFEPVPNGNGMDGAIGVLKLKLGDELIINDGQHRCAGIAEALKENPNIGDHTIAVLLFPYENKDRVQQMFSDLNRYGQKNLEVARHPVRQARQDFSSDPGLSGASAGVPRPSEPSPMPRVSLP